MGGISIGKCKEIVDLELRTYFRIPIQRMIEPFEKRCLACDQKTLKCNI